MKLTSWEFFLIILVLAQADINGADNIKSLFGKLQEASKKSSKLFHKKTDNEKSPNGKNMKDEKIPHLSSVSNIPGEEQHSLSEPPIKDEDHAQNFDDQIKHPANDVHQSLPKAAEILKGIIDNAKEAHSDIVDDSQSFLLETINEVGKMMEQPLLNNEIKNGESLVEVFRDNSISKSSRIPESTENPETGAANGVTGLLDHILENSSSPPLLAGEEAEEMLEELLLENDNDVTQSYHDNAITESLPLPAAAEIDYSSTMSRIEDRNDSQIPIKQEEDSTIKAIPSFPNAAGTANSISNDVTRFRDSLAKDDHPTTLLAGDAAEAIMSELLLEERNDAKPVQDSNDNDINILPVPEMAKEETSSVVSGTKYDNYLQPSTNQEENTTIENLHLFSKTSKSTNNISERDTEFLDDVAKNQNSSPLLVEDEAEDMMEKLVLEEQQDVNSARSSNKNDVTESALSEATKVETGSPVLNAEEKHHLGLPINQEEDSIIENLQSFLKIAETVKNLAEVDTEFFDDVAKNQNSSPLLVEDEAEDMMEKLVLEEQHDVNSAQGSNRNDVTKSALESEATNVETGSPVLNAEDKNHLALPMNQEEDSIIKNLQSFLETAETVKNIAEGDTGFFDSVATNQDPSPLLVEDHAEDMMEKLVFEEQHDVNSARGSNRNDVTNSALESEATRVETGSPVLNAEDKNHLALPIDQEEYSIIENLQSFLKIAETVKNLAEVDTEFFDSAATNQDSSPLLVEDGAEDMMEKLVLEEQHDVDSARSSNRNDVTNSALESEATKVETGSPVLNAEEKHHLALPINQEEDSIIENLQSFLKTAETVKNIAEGDTGFFDSVATNQDPFPLLVEDHAEDIMEKLILEEENDVNSPQGFNKNDANSALESGAAREEAGPPVLGKGHYIPINQEDSIAENLQSLPNAAGTVYGFAGRVTGTAEKDYSLSLTAMKNQSQNKKESESLADQTGSSQTFPPLLNLNEGNGLTEKITTEDDKKKENGMPHDDSNTIRGQSSDISKYMPNLLPSITSSESSMQQRNENIAGSINSNGVSLTVRSEPISTGSTDSKPTLQNNSPSVVNKVQQSVVKPSSTLQSQQNQKPQAQSLDLFLFPIFKVIPQIPQIIPQVLPIIPKLLTPFIPPILSNILFPKL